MKTVSILHCNHAARAKAPIDILDFPSSVLLGAFRRCFLKAISLCIENDVNLSQYFSYSGMFECVVFSMALVMMFKSFLR